MRKNRKSILDMSAKEAKNFLLKPTSYVNLQLPEYFNFQEVLQQASSKLTGRSLKGISDIKKLRETQDANYTVLINKDGGYDWRPVQIIHPLLYVNLVNCLTEEEHWKIILNRFSEFQKNKKISCISIPVESISNKSDTAETILNWWEGLEQNSIVQSLEYSWCIKTDVTNCYGSIYTHTIAWALHGKEHAKKQRNDQKLLGNLIDTTIENIQHGQTNGIPQGGTLFDLIAEMVLGYADLQLSQRLEKLELKDYKVLRYRDDYRIFANDETIVSQIVKELSDVLSDLNMHFNSKKTGITQDIIENAIKPDKKYWNAKVPIISTKSETNKGTLIYNLSLQKHLLEILWLSQAFPNSGSIKKAFTDFAKRLDTENSIRDPKPLISIVSSIICENPTAIPSGVAILGRIISKVNKQETTQLISETVSRINQKIKNMPNHGFLDVWLQRLSLIADDSNTDSSEKLCAAVDDEKYHIWNSSWITGKDRTKPIVSENIKKEIQIKIPDEVFDTFITYEN